MNDICIRCGKGTEYSQSTPVDKRFCYVPGSGQMCVGCYCEVFKADKKVLLEAKSAAAETT